MLRHIGALLLLMCTYQTWAVVELPGVLVDSAWLEANLDTVVVLDIRDKTDTFTEIGHIPNARLVNAKNIRSHRKVDGFDMEKVVPTKAEFATLMSELGINNDDSIIITYQGVDALDFAWATRLYWTFKYFGMNKIAILNGGTSVWQAAGHALSKEATPKVAATKFTVSTERPEVLATTAEVKAAMENGDMQLLDTRDLGFYFGISQKSYVYGKGHIPTAKVWPFTLLTSYNAPSVVLEADMLKASFEAMKIDPSKPSAIYCNSGHIASSVWFVMSEVMGNKEVQMYDGSMHAWTKDSSLPLETMQMN